MLWTSLLNSEILPHLNWTDQTVKLQAITSMNTGTGHARSSCFYEEAFTEPLGILSSPSIETMVEVLSSDMGGELFHCCLCTTPSDGRLWLVIELCRLPCLAPVRKQHHCSQKMQATLYIFIN